MDRIKYLANLIVGREDIPDRRDRIALCAVEFTKCSDFFSLKSIFYKLLIRKFFPLENQVQTPLEEFPANLIGYLPMNALERCTAHILKKYPPPEGIDLDTIMPIVSSEELCNIFQSECKLILQPRGIKRDSQGGILSNEDSTTNEWWIRTYDFLCRQNQTYRQRLSVLLRSAINKLVILAVLATDTYYFHQRAREQMITFVLEHFFGGNKIVIIRYHDHCERVVNDRVRHLRDTIVRSDESSSPRLNLSTSKRSTNQNELNIIISKARKEFETQLQTISAYWELNNSKFDIMQDKVTEKFNEGNQELSTLFSPVVNVLDRDLNSLTNLQILDTFTKLSYTIHPPSIERMINAQSTSYSNIELLSILIDDFNPMNEFPDKKSELFLDKVQQVLLLKEWKRKIKRRKSTTSIGISAPFISSDITPSEPTINISIASLFSLIDDITSGHKIAQDLCGELLKKI
ncbi:uncharacterized protein CMU_013900 [Cryptosporidium muris RN66]|uniref:Uncharacterized protein n=1 Tax=Cryptosporidium muris (strain RN66) TaxID=441375 RepID=B6AEU8_CRYMR|nr:uncharacterized protein CMU_013900 [Cryptosporidium muris RN66]EEA06715.1 hypothetical protein CMU_013900 [Cryptosporidium muris RN66]|eukprot:XP_002141064.1 hypothetical protein [Cryptosporidium muris RN66]